jgi:hypothetical protein
MCKHNDKTCGSVHTSLLASALLVTVGSKAAKTTYLYLSRYNEHREVFSAAASIYGGRRVRLDDTPKSVEPLLAPSTLKEPKMLTGSGQKARSRLPHHRLGAHGLTRLPVLQAGANSSVSQQQNIAIPTLRPGLGAGAPARGAGGVVGKGCWKKQMPLCNGADKGCNSALPPKRADFQRVIHDKRTDRTFIGGNSK